jgi:hypothetical protein
MENITLAYITKPVRHYEVGIWNRGGEPVIEWYASYAEANARYKALKSEEYRQIWKSVKMRRNDSAEYSAEWGMYEGPRVAIVKILSDEMSPIFRFAFTSKAFGHTVEVWQASHFKPQYHRMDE